jgi:hypothetical protein
MGQQSVRAYLLLLLLAAVLQQQPQPQQRWVQLGPAASMSWETYKVRCGPLHSSSKYKGLIALLS